MEKESAEIIQRWWKKKLETDKRIAEKTKNIAESKYIQEITLHNNSLIEKLKQLRKEKTLDVMRYERILNMPARDVNDFMKMEMKKKCQEELSMLDKNELEKRHKAAKVIQRSFQKYHREQIAKKYLRSLRVIKPAKRVEFLEQINDRLGKKKSVIIVPLEEIKSKLSEHKSTLEKDGVTFAKRNQLIQSVKRASMSIAMVSLDLLQQPNIHALHVSSPYINYKAQKFHEESMKHLEEDEWA